MTIPGSNRDYLIDILDAITKATIFVQGMTIETFQTDDKTIYAVIRALEVIGEATKRIPTDVRNHYPTIPWRAMTGMRDKLIHDYAVVDVDVVWKTVTDDLPRIRPLIEQIISRES